MLPPEAISPPLLTADLPGIGGRIKGEIDDFEVEEIAAYEPCGEGEFLYLWIEKRDMGAEFFARQVAHRLGISPGEIGSAGLKDRRAVTRQWISVPGAVEPALAQLEGDGLHVVKVSRHNNKLRPGHLHGNRFRILVRDVESSVDTDATLAPVVERIRTHGLPNYYGPQRFGRDGETLELGLTLLRGEPVPRRLSPFLRKLALSAVQSGLFNLYVAQRMRDGLMRRVLAGDVMAKVPAGGMFVAENVEEEQRRFDAGEIVPAGPLFGRKTFPARDEAARRETAILESVQLRPDSFNGFGKLLQGTRRHNLVYIPDLSAVFEPDGLRLTFTLPAGSYATILLKELMKNNVDAE